MARAVHPHLAEPGWGGKAGYRLTFRTGIWARRRRRGHTTLEIAADEIGPSLR